MKHIGGRVALAIQIAAMVGCQVSMSSTLGTTLRGRGGGGDDQSITMPDVFLMSQADAEAALQRAGFERSPKLDTRSICGSTVDKKIIELGHVCYQTPAAGLTASPRTAVTIRVQTENPYHGELGNGRFWFLMPDLVGTHVDKGRARLKELGFTTKEVNIAYVDRPGCAPNIICEMSPEGLTRADNTSDKLFYVGRPADPPKQPDPRTTKPADPKPPPQPKKPDDIF